MERNSSEGKNQAIVRRNQKAILDAAELLLERRERTSVSAVAAQAGVSRVTVYSHFSGQEPILEAVVGRAVGRAVAALKAAEPDRGPADEALARVLAASWEELGHNAAIVRAAMVDLSAEAMRRSHGQGRTIIRKLIERGRQDGTFRSDLETDWLLISFFALIHAARDEVQAGRVRAESALESLLVTIGDLFRGP